MKKYILSLLAALLAGTGVLSPLTARSLTAQADGKTQYARIQSETTYLYASADETSGLFILPCTYYVEVLSDGGAFSYVRYGENTAPYHAVYGYCRSEELTPVSYTPARPYLFYTLTATYRLEGFREDFADGLSSLTVSYAYYGDFPVGSAVYCYVSSAERTGYIPKTGNIVYERNEDPDPQPTPSPDSPTAETETGNAVRIVFACVVGALGVAVVLCAVLKKKPLPVPETDPYET